MKGKIGYIRKEIPSFEIPPYRGERYEDLVPDTLDLAERAELAINGLTGPTDPEADYEIYWQADFFSNPPAMRHDFCDMVQAKFMEALPLLRIAAGSDLNSHVDRAWMEVILKSIGPDGLFYIPTEGRPWARLNNEDAIINAVCRADGSTTKISDGSVTQFTLTFSCGRVISAMTIYYLRDGNPVWKETIERMIQRLSQLAIDKGDYCYFPNAAFEPDAKVSLNAEMPTGRYVENGGVRLIQALAQYYKVTGYEPARELGEKLVRYVKDHGKYPVDAEGRFMPDRSEEYYAAQEMHFHSHTIDLLCILEYALAVGDRTLMEYVKRGYEYAKAQGAALVGFFPEFVRPYYPSSEICEVADIIALASKLTEAGVGDYWDDVDRWVRNQFAESQLTKADWVYRIPRLTYPSTRWHPLHFNESSDRVAERNLGAFAGWPSGNDWTIRIGIMHCCTGNATRTIYYVWENILDYKDGRLRVNLLLNRASPWADVHSYIPYEGRVDLKIKKPCEDVLVRIPEWIETNSKQVTCTVNGEPHELSWSGRYVKVGKAKSGDIVAVSFPIWERTVKEMIGGVLYTLIIKGNTVVSIDPPGKNCPLYHRAHYRENQARWRKIKRFVSEEQIRW